MSEPLEELPAAVESFERLTPGEQDRVREALESIELDPTAGRPIPARFPGTAVEYTYTTPLAKDSAEAVTVVYVHEPGIGIAVVLYFRDPLRLT
ncbi:hypothetical protein [Streptomyces sp. NPDC048603]|uniref:hypothetical protein n=1 Tax=Streptomyces sp. NPDC048603 TaxID=3365577 RepID=UPI0037159A5E